MNFLNIGPWELMVILIIAILLVGPRRVVEIARAIGRVTAQMRKLSGEFMGTIQAELRATEQETRQALDSVVGEARRPVISVPAEIQAAERETHQALEEILEGVGDLVKGKRSVKEGKDGEAGGEQPDRDVAS